MKVHRTTALAILLIAMLAACGGNDADRTPTPTSADQGAAMPTASPTSQDMTPTSASAERGCELTFAGALADDHYRVYCVNADGSDLHPLTPYEFRHYEKDTYEAFPTFSPDGSQVAFMRYGKVEIEGVWIINVDGTNEQHIIGGWARDIAWSPDGSQLAFAWLQWGWPPYEKGQGVGKDGNPMKIVVVNADGTNQREINVSLEPATGPVTDLMPLWSPDGNQILFQRWTHAADAEEDVIELYTVNVDGSDLRQMPLDDAMPILMPGQVTWSPDGSQVVFVGGVADSEESLGIYAIGLDGTGLTRLSNAAAIGALAWSPDGTRLAFTGATEEIDSATNWEQLEFDLFAMSADGSAVQRITGQPGTMELNPSWSPDGTRLLYTAVATEPGAEDDMPRATLAIVDTDGSNPVAVVEDIVGKPQFDAAPMWQPDPS